MKRLSKNSRDCWRSSGILALALTALCCLSGAVFAQGASPYTKIVNYDAKQFEIAMEQGKQVIYLVGDVVFETEEGFIYCDSAVLKPGERVRLKGRVRIDDPEYRLNADSVTYVLASGEANAWGKSVDIWSFKDSLYAVGTHAFLKRTDRFFFMDERPTLYLNYPDSARMVEVIADRIEYSGFDKRSQASGNVTINSSEIATESGCALMQLQGGMLDLFEKPILERGKSRMGGELITITYKESLLDRVVVYDSAWGSFKEPVDSTKDWYDEAKLQGKQITLLFTEGDLDSVICAGSAYSWYYPAKKDQNTQYENAVSGDTIYFDILDEQLQDVLVVGESIGRYVSTEIKAADGDSIPKQRVDTVDYQARTIAYDIKDSLITLERSVVVSSGSMELDAEQVLFDTRTARIEAFSASIDSGGDVVPSEGLHVQPNAIPVVLKDNNETVYGDYLEYSLRTEKGRIKQSKSAYEQGFYYGERLYREQKRIFYVEDGRYTTCDSDQPHFHFYSSNMKLVENDKLIAKPVVFYLERLPLFALPYYVFPLKRGRHSGILPLEFGQFQQDRRYVRNVGYYWAASDYWDWQGAFDYYELQRTINLNSRINFAQRYVLNGYISASASLVSSYSTVAAQETSSKRWTLAGAYNHTITPDFEVRSYGSFQSDARYYTDYSSNLEERLNRSVKSQASFVKRFGSSVSLAGSFTHTVNLDLESRADVLPDMTLSLPTIKPFGSGSRTESGAIERRWYQGFSLRYSPHFVNSSNRSVRKEISGTDTTTTRTRREYARIDHNPQLTLPTLTLVKYVNVVPSIRYNESWYRVFPTDQSDNAGIDESRWYRTYTYSGNLSMNTKLYGTLTPHLFGVQAVRHVISPTVGYAYVPEIHHNSLISSYAGGVSGTSNRGSILDFSIDQLLQAKVGDEETGRTLDLLNVSSSFSYNLEDVPRPISDLFTSFHTSSIPRLNLSGSMTHTFYKEDSDDYDIWAPKLTNFSVNMSTQLRGSRFIFDDPRTPMVREPLNPLEPAPFVRAPTTGTAADAAHPQGWSASIQYGYAESRFGDAIRKTSNFIALLMNFNLTPSTSVTYQQRYNFLDQQTTGSSISIQKTLHCWTGSLYWVPVGSNRGFGFRLFVTALPEIKLDDRYDNFLEGVRR